MKIIVLILGGCLLAGAACGAEPGAIAGHVIVTRALTKERVSLPVYALRGVAPGSDNSHESALRKASGLGELSRVVIYLQGPGLPHGTPVVGVLTQKNRRFDPDFLVIPVGSAVSFPNDDPIFHNVFSLSKAKSFDLGYYPQGETRKIKFDRPGVVQVYCHIHSDMSAAILVVPTAFWTRSSADGSFSFKDVPPGTYELVAWHRSAGVFRYKVTVEPRQKHVMNIEIPVRESVAKAAAETEGSGL